MDPKIGDFGLSRFLQSNDVAHTQNNAIPIRWMAPESLSQQTYSVASDVWSWAVLVSEILNREQPYNNLDLFTGKEGTKRNDKVFSAIWLNLAKLQKKPCHFFCFLPLLMMISWHENCTRGHQTCITSCLS